MLSFKRFLFLVAIALFAAFVFYTAHTKGYWVDFAFAMLVVLFLVLQTANFILDAFLEALDEFIEKRKKEVDFDD